MERSVVVALPLILCLLASSAWASPGYCENESVAKEDLKQKLLATYGNRFSTVKMLLDAGMNDYKNICSAPNSEPSQGIIKKLSGTYYPHFSTIWMLYESNYSDYKALQ